MSPLSPEPASLDRRDLLSALLVAVVALVVFANTVSHQFINYDDPWQITENPYVQDLTWTNLKHILAQPIHSIWLPTKTLSYAVDDSLWGLNPRGFHTTNVALHAVASVLVFFVARQLLQGRVWAAVAGLLFAVHPVHVEAVAWLSARKDLLSTAFVLLSVLAFLKWRRAGRRAWVWYAGSLLAFLLASRAKPTAHVLPVLLLCLDVVLPRHGNASRRLGLRSWWWLRGTVPFLVLAAVMTFVDWQLATALGYAEAETGGELVWKVALACVAFVRYAGLLVFPVQLSPQYRVARPEGLGDPLALAGAALFLVGVGLVGWGLMRRRAVGGALGWYVFAVLPVCGLLPIAVPSPVADRYLYLPSVGAFILVGRVLEAVASRLGRVGRWALAGATVVVLSVLATQSWVQSGVWRTSESLWGYVLAKDPENYNAHINLGAAVFERGDYEAARKHYLQATELAPGLIHAYRSLGSIAMKAGQLESARQWLLRAVGSPPANILTPAKVSRTRAQASGQLILVEAHMKKARHLLAEAEAALDAQDHGKAEECLSKALEEQPDLVEASLALSAFLRKSDRAEEALRVVERAARLSPGEARLELERARILVARGDLEAAREALNRADEMGASAEELVAAFREWRKAHSQPGGTRVGPE